MEESYFPPMSLPKKVDDLLPLKKSSSGEGIVGVPNLDDLYPQQEEDDGEFDINVSLEKFLASILQDQDNKEEYDEFEETGTPISPERNFIWGSEVTNSEPLSTRPLIRSRESRLGIVTQRTAPRRIRLQNHLQVHELAVDHKAARSSTDDPDHREEPPSLTGLSSQFQDITRSLIAKDNKYLEWVFILTNIVLEILLIVLDQIACREKPQYALAALVLSLVAITVSVIELSFKTLKQEVILKRQGIRIWFQYPSSTHKPFYNFIDVFGFICALCQFIFSAVAYSYHSRHADNPINISIVSLIFIICVASSKFSEDCKEAPISAPV